MPNLLCFTIRFLDPDAAFHGCGDMGEAEWPPSPLRLFQALVAATAIRWHQQQLKDVDHRSLNWLQRQDAPTIIAPPHRVGTPVRTAVPNNDLDIVLAAWSQHREPKKQANELKTMKTVRPIRLLVTDDSPALVHYIFPLDDWECPHVENLRLMSQSITHLGWGIDMVAADIVILSRDEVAQLVGERWEPVKDPSARGYRLPQEGTLVALDKLHEEFLNRVGPDGFKPVVPLSVFRVVGYRRAIEPTTRPIAAFSILKPDASGMRTFDPIRRTRDVAGMVRHAVATTAKAQGWPQEVINSFVHGKSLDGSMPPSGQRSIDRFQYLPLPTINHALGRVESIRRVLITAPSHCNQQITWARRAMAGADLTNDNGVAALLTILPGSDWVLRQYIEESTTWSTVTPVILPGYDDPDHLRRKLKNGLDAETQKRYLTRLDARVDNLLRKAFRQAGYSNELIDQLELEWSDVGFQPGVDLASRYLPPENLGNAPRYHIRAKFPVAIRGPVAVGSGRFRGFGVFTGTR